MFSNLILNEKAGIGMAILAASSFLTTKNKQRTMTTFISIPFQSLQLTTTIILKGLEKVM